MPLHNEPPRPPDGVGRQAIRIPPPKAGSPPDRARPSRPLVARRRGAAWLLVVVADAIAVSVVGSLVDGRRWLDAWVVVGLVGCAAAAVALLVASRSGRRR